MSPSTEFCENQWSRFYTLLLIIIIIIIINNVLISVTLSPERCRGTLQSH